MNLPTYALVTPARDEAEHLTRIANSIAAQQHRPLQWVIVDDNSTDGTRAIAEHLAARHDWITVVTGPPSGHRRERGAPIVRAFNLGLQALRRRPDITVKLDADLYLAPHFFAWVAGTFAREPRAGVVGAAVLLMPENGRWIRDPISEHTVAGAAKAYRTDCLEEMGGLRPSMGWDGIDEYSARARGWMVFPLTELTLLHYGRRGAKQAWYRARWEEGLANHYMGYLPQWLVVRAAFQMLAGRPRLLGGLVLAAGYTWAHARSLPQVDDALARKVLQQEQRERLRALLHGRRQVRNQAPTGGGPAFWIGNEGLPTADDAGASSDGMG